MNIDYSAVDFATLVHAQPMPVQEPIPAQPTGGVGTELLNDRMMRAVKWWLGNSCGCRQRAREWDANGIQWCEEHVHDELLPALKATAERFKLPWSEAIALRAVRGAIDRAKRKASRPTG